VIKFYPLHVLHQEQKGSVIKMGLWQAGIRYSIFWDISALVRPDNAKAFKRYRKIKKKIENM